MQLTRMFIIRDKISNTILRDSRKRFKLTSGFKRSKALPTLSEKSRDKHYVNMNCRQRLLNSMKEENTKVLSEYTKNDVKPILIRLLSDCKKHMLSIYRRAGRP